LLKHPFLTEKVNNFNNIYVKKHCKNIDNNTLNPIKNENKTIWAIYCEKDEKTLISLSSYQNSNVIGKIKKDNFSDGQIYLNHRLPSFVGSQNPFVNIIPNTILPNRNTSINSPQNRNYQNNIGLNRSTRVIFNNRPNDNISRQGNQNSINNSNYTYHSGNIENRYKPTENEEIDEPKAGGCIIF
jgi:hypothetical protein